MLKKPKTCNNCVLANISKGFSIPDGDCKNGVLIIGESLGQNELKDARPFRPYAEAGSALNTAIIRLGLNREDFGFWNLISCCPPFNKLEGAKYESEAISYCKVHYFDEVIKKLKPKVIIAAGSLPLKYLIPEISLWRQKAKDENNKTLLRKLSITSLRGYKFTSSYNIPIVPTLHPSFIRRQQMIYLGILMRDIDFAVNIAKNKVSKLDFKYRAIKDVKELEDFYAYCIKHKNLPISYDIETPLTTIETDETEIDFREVSVRNIDTIQFSIEDYDSIFVQWQEPYLDLIKKLLALSNPKVGWNNWEFDQVNIEYHLGQNAIKGNNFDAMWLWKHLNSDFSKLGRGLQFASNFFSPSLPAWKHLSEDEPERYGTIDVYATRKNFEGLKIQTEKLRFSPESKSVFEGYVDDIVNLRPVLNDISKRGLPIDDDAKKELSKLVNGEIVKAQDELQVLFPEHLRLKKPLEGYKNEPKEIEEIRRKTNELVGFKPTNGSTNLFGNYEFIIHSDSNSINSRLIEFFTRQKGKTGLVKKQFTIDGRKVFRYCRLEEFKPNSSPQVISYMRWKRHKVPTKREKDGPKETSSKEDVSKLFEETGDRFYELIVYIRELKKIDSTYIKGWKTDENSRVHTTFIPIAATGQLGSRNPNIQNAPARGTRFSSKGYKQLAEQFRTIVAASEGKSIVEVDYSSFHALTLGFEAEDEKYIRLVRNDIHSYIAAQFLRDELSQKMQEQRVLKGGKLEIKDIKEYEKCEKGIDFLKDLDLWLSLDDSELRLKLKWIKNNFAFTRNSQSKPSILGIGFGAEPKKIYTLNRYSFKSQAQVEVIFKFLRMEFPKIFDYQERIMNLADKQTYLISRYGYIRRFFDVFDYRLLNHYRSPKGVHEKIFKDSKGRWWSKSLGGQAKEAIAFYPANDAFGKKKEAFLELWDYKLFDGKHVNLIQKYGAVNEIHDSIIFECSDELIPECAKVVKEVMERPAIMLKNSVTPDGLICLTEVKVGKNWGNFNDNPEKGIINLNGMRDYKV